MNCQSRGYCLQRAIKNGSYCTAIVGLVLLMVTEGNARPYPAFTGRSAAADSPATAGTNPAGITRFDSLNTSFEVYVFDSESTWSSVRGDSGTSRISKDSSTQVVPSGALVMPIGNDWYFGFTVLGASLSEDYEPGWPGRYFIQDYDLLYVSAFPSIARKINDQWSVAGSLALTYTKFEQNKAVLNDPGLDDGNLTIDADGLTAGFALSTLYELSDRTRFGLVYSSKIDSEKDGTAEFSGLGPIRESVLDMAGLLNARIDVNNTTPQSISAGVFHEFENQHAATFDVAWIDFSEFVLSEIYVNDNQILANNVDYDDIWAVTAGYSWPVNDRTMLGVGVLLVDDMVADQERSMTLRLDDIWGVGVGVEWKWKPTRVINATLDYIEIGSAPVTAPEIPGFGVVAGEYTDRRTLLFRVGIEFGNGPR